MTTIEELRQEKRRQRSALGKSALERAAGELATRIIELDEYRRAQRVAAYFAVNGEISLDAVIKHALDAGKQVFLPILERQALRFAPYSLEQKMRMNRFRLPEPDVADEAMLAPVELDLVLAPLVVFDAERNRIGMGGGFYDRSFAFRKDSRMRSPCLIGVAHELQKVAALEPQAWDVRLDMIVSDAAVYR